MNRHTSTLTQTTLLQQATTALTHLLAQPVTWHREVETLTICLGGHFLPAWVELRLPEVFSQTQKAVLITPYLSSRQAEHLRALGQPYLDGAGNAHLRVGNHFVWIQGRPRRQDARALTYPSAYPAASLRLLYYLLSEPDLLQAPYRHLAERTGIALGSVHAFFGKARQQLVEEQAGQRQWVRPGLALASWVEGYAQLLRPALQPRRYRWLREPQTSWRQLPLARGAYWSGEPGARLLLGERHVAPSSFTLFSPTLPEGWGLMSDPVGGQVEVLLPPFPLPPATGSIPPLLTYTELRLAAAPSVRALAQAVLNGQLPHLK